MKFLPNTITALIVLAAQTKLASSSNFGGDPSDKALHTETASTGGLRGRNLFVSMKTAEVSKGNSPESPPEALPGSQPTQGSHPGSNPQNPPITQQSITHPNPPQNLRDCSVNKKVTLYKFCITGDCDQGINGEHKLILNEFMDGEEKYKENKCHDLNYHPQIVEAGNSLVVGTIEHDDDEEEEFIKELHPDRWYDDTCGTYYIALSKDFTRLFTGAQSWSGCWFSEHSGEMQPQSLNYDHCPHNNYERPRDSFNWFLKVESNNDNKVDYPNWHDSAGREFDCVWYSYGNRCAEIGDSYSNFGYTANQACAACGGGVFL